METALGTGHAHMVKTFTGAVDGRSLTQFSFAFSPETGVGTYVAMEAFEGTVDGRRGTFNFAPLGHHERQRPHRRVLPHRAEQRHRRADGHHGRGSVVIDDDGERMVFDYSL